MAGYIATKGLNSDGEPDKLKKARAGRGAAAKCPRGPRHSSAKKLKLTQGGDETDDQDTNFATGSSESKSSNDSKSGVDEVLSNAEVRNCYSALSTFSFT